MRALAGILHRGHARACAAVFGASRERAPAQAGGRYTHSVGYVLRRVRAAARHWQIRNASRYPRTRVHVSALWRAGVSSSACSCIHVAPGSGPARHVRVFACSLAQPLVAASLACQRPLWRRLERSLVGVKRAKKRPHKAGADRKAWRLFFVGIWGQVREIPANVFFVPFSGARPAPPCSRVRHGKALATLRAWVIAMSGHGVVPGVNVAENAARRMPAPGPHSLVCGRARHGTL